MRKAKVLESEMATPVPGSTEVRYGWRQGGGRHMHDESAMVITVIDITLVYIYLIDLAHLTLLT